MTKEEKLVLKELKKQGNYDQILFQFGQKAFIKSVDSKYRKQDIAKLKKEGKYEAIYLRYGKSAYNSLLNEAKQREIEEVYGKRSLKSISHKISYKVKSALATLLYSTAIIGGTSTLAIAGTTIAQHEAIKNENYHKYEDVINEYEGKIEKYAEHIKAMNLTDLETFVKLEDDIHKSILGYANPRLDIEGYYGVDIGQDLNGTGVCRNMADDMARKLNAINPDYNARMITVKAYGDASEISDVNRYKWSSDESKKDRFATDTAIRNAVFRINHITHDNSVFNVLANHAVVAVDLKDKNTTLIIDPTSTFIGVFKDGNITLFGSMGKVNPWNMYRTPLDDFAYRGLDSLALPDEYIKSFLNPFTTIDELNAEYGIDAQNAALASVKAKEEHYIHTQSKQNDFKNSIKVNLDEKQNENIYSLDELQNIYDESIKNIDSIHTKQEALELGNTYREIKYNIDYYNKHQEEILGKQVLHQREQLTSKLLVNMSKFKTDITQKLIETDALVLPEDCDNKNLLCGALLDAGNNEKLQDLKIAQDDSEKSTYYILNGTQWLVGVAIEERGAQFKHNNSRCVLEESKIEKLFKNSSPIVQQNDKVKTDNNSITL